MIYIVLYFDTKENLIVRKIEEKFFQNYVCENTY